MVVVFPYLPGSSSPAFQGVSIFFGVLLVAGTSLALTANWEGLEVDPLPYVSGSVAFVLGGGAFLEYVEGKVLPAVAMLEQRARAD